MTRRSRKDFSIVHNVTSRQSLPDSHILIYKTEACRVFETDAGHDPSPKKFSRPLFHRDSIDCQAVYLDS